MKSKPLRVVVLRGLGLGLDGDFLHPPAGTRKKAAAMCNGKANATDGGKAQANDDGSEDETKRHDVSNREEASEQVRAPGEGDDD